MSKKKAYQRELVLALILLTLIGVYLLQNNTITHAEHDFHPNADSHTSDATLVFTSTIPYDVDLTGVNSLATAQRAFDTNSWLTFIAMNWPLDEDGNPLPNLTADGTPRWQTWKESFEVFKEDGSVPSPWGHSDIPNYICDNNKLSNTQRILYLANKADVLDEVKQAQ
ncbi:hypothetical protein KFU94_33415 [Chloroflexi bacterium TSY]|nr:hypothetical protein [Chloroflexi bacterium TSY]